MQSHRCAGTSVSHMPSRLYTVSTLHFSDLKLFNIPLGFTFYMTAFDEILNAEKDALQAIEAAKTEVSEALATAKAEGKVKIDSEKERLAAVTNEELKAHASQVKAKTDKIQSGVEKEVAAVTQKFTAVLDNVKKDILQAIAE